MSTDPIDRLPSAFGSVLERLRHERGWDAEALANAANLSPREIQGIEGGTHIPTLLGFFRLSIALGASPVILLTEVIAEWRADPTDHGLYRSRPSDLARLYRLGYFHNPGDFRELQRAYDLMDQVTGAVRSLNVSRRERSLPPLNTICIYMRVGSIVFRPDEEGQS